MVQRAGAAAAAAVAAATTAATPATPATVSPRTRRARANTTARAGEWSALGDVLQPLPTRNSAGGVSPRGESPQQPDTYFLRQPLAGTTGRKRRPTAEVDAAASPPPHEQLRAVFATLDRNADGMLNREELKAAIIANDDGEELLGGADDEAEVDRLMQQMDMDGKSSISCDEFCQLIRGQRAQRAALYIEDGLSAISTLNIGTRSLRLQRWYCAPRWQRLVLGTCLLHMSVAFFENPARIPASKTPHVNVFNMLVVYHPWARYLLLAIEAACVAVYLLDACIYIGFRRPAHPADRAAAAAAASSDTAPAAITSGRRSVCRCWPGQQQRRRQQQQRQPEDLWVVARLCIATVMAVDLLLALCALLRANGNTTAATSSGPQEKLMLCRFSRALRPFVFASRKRGTREVLKNVASAVPSQGALVLGLAAVVGLWAFVGFLLFKGMDTENFGSVPSSLNAMVMTLFSPSFQQPLLESKMQHHSWAALFYVSFLLVCNMFILRLVTAVAFESYQAFARSERMAVLSARKYALDRAFYLVAEPATLPTVATSWAHDAAPARPPPTPATPANVDAAEEESDAVRAAHPALPPDQSQYHHDLRMSLSMFIQVMTHADAHAGAKAVSKSASRYNRSDNGHSSLGPDDKAALLFSIADTDADSQLSLEEFYVVCFLWRYAMIRPVNAHGQPMVRLDQRRWVPAGTAVYYRASAAVVEPQQQQPVPAAAAKDADDGPGTPTAAAAAATQNFRAFLLATVPRRATPQPTQQQVDAGIEMGGGLDQQQDGSSARADGGRSCQCRCCGGGRRGWKKGVAVGNTSEGFVRVRELVHNGSDDGDDGDSHSDSATAATLLFSPATVDGSSRHVTRLGSLQEPILQHATAEASRPPETGQVHTAARTNTVLHLAEPDICVDIMQHPHLGTEEMLEHRVRPCLTMRKLGLGHPIRSFDVCMSVLVLLNLAQLGLTASAPDHSPINHRGRSGVALEVVAVVLLCAFAGESLVKLQVWGWEKYRRHSAVLDLLSLGAGLTQYGLYLGAAVFGAGGSSSIIINQTAHFRAVLLVLQVLRVIKLLPILAPAMSGAVERVAIHALDFLFVFGLMIYVAAIIGNEVFAGRMDRPGLEHHDLDWLQVQLIFNFDDFSTSLLALFQVALVSNWFVISDAAALASTTALGQAAARGYFLLFKAATTIFALPIFMGFVITAFSKVYHQVQEDTINDAGAGIVAALPMSHADDDDANEDDQGGGSVTTPAPSPPAARGRQHETAARLKLFVVKVNTDVTNKLYGLDSEMAQARRQVRQQQAYSTLLESELGAVTAALEQREQAANEMWALISEHGLGASFKGAEGGSEQLERLKQMIASTSSVSSLATPSRPSLPVIGMGRPLSSGGASLFSSRPSPMLSTSVMGGGGALATRQHRAWSTGLISPAGPFAPTSANLSASGIAPPSSFLLRQDGSSGSSSPRQLQQAGATAAMAVAMASPRLLPRTSSIENPVPSSLVEFQAELATFALDLRGEGHNALEGNLDA